MKRKLTIFALILITGYSVTAQYYQGGIITGQSYPDSSHSPKIACDTLFSFTPQETWPAGLAFDGTTLYINGFDGMLISKYNLSGQLTGTIPSPGNGANNGGDMDFDGVNLWVVIENEGKLFKLDPSNGTVLDSFYLPGSSLGDPNNYGCAYEDGNVWTTQYGWRTLMRINITNGALVDSFAINRMVLPLKIIHGDLCGIEFLGTTGLYQIDKFDKATGAVIDSMPWCLPLPVGFVMVEDHLWGVSSKIEYGGTQRIYQFDSLIFSTENLNVTDIPVSVYPNPADDRISINYNGNHKVEISVFNILGECVLQGELTNGIHEINISSLERGLYEIRITIDQWTEIQKLIKN
ncbi:MAG: T9SS type A sorting domain-containing protein [Bacteroidetes bacterium]|nr:T9SS type A sorting domain-containing protein [Bacteroidota bacterium]